MGESGHMYVATLYGRLSLYIRYTCIFHLLCTLTDVFSLSQKKLILFFMHSVYNLHSNLMMVKKGSYVDIKLYIQYK